MALLPVTFEMAAGGDEYDIPPAFGNVRIFTDDGLMYRMHDAVGRYICAGYSSDVDVAGLIDYGKKLRVLSDDGIDVLQNRLACEGKIAVNLLPVTMSDDDIGMLVRALVPVMNRLRQNNDPRFIDWQFNVAAAQRQVYWQSLALLNAIRQQQDDSDDEWSTHKPRVRRAPASKYSRSSVRRRRV